MLFKLLFIFAPVAPKEYSYLTSFERSAPPYVYVVVNTPSPPRLISRRPAPSVDTCYHYQFFCFALQMWHSCISLEQKQKLIFELTLIDN